MTANLPVIIDASTVVDMNSERRLRLSARLYLWNDMYSFISLSPSLTVSDYWYDPVNQSLVLGRRQLVIIYKVAFS